MKVTYSKQTACGYRRNHLDSLYADIRAFAVLSYICVIYVFDVTRKLFGTTDRAFAVQVFIRFVSNHKI
jgi:hypothetical protein